MALAVGDFTSYGIVRFEARHGAKGYLLQAVVPAIIGGIIGTLYVVYIRNPDDPTGTRVLVLGLAYLIIVSALAWGISSQKVRFQVTDTHVVKHRLLRAPLAIPRGAIAEAVVTKDYQVSRMRGPRLFFLDRTTTTLMSSAPLTDLEAVEGLALAATRVTRLAALDPQQAALRWPNMLPRSHVKPFKWGLIVSFGIIVAIVAVVVVIAAISG